MIGTRKQRTKPKHMKANTEPASTLILTPSRGGEDIKSVTVATCNNFNLAPGEVAVPAPVGFTIGMIRDAYRRIRVPVFVL